MSWANFNYNYYPNIIITFNKNLENDDDFNYFLESWTKIINKNEKYTLLFDTNNLGKIKLSYVNKLKKFLDTIKKLPVNNLKWNIIIIRNKFIKFIIELLLKISKPNSKVFILKKIDNFNYKELIDNVKNNNIEKFSVINP